MRGCPVEGCPEAEVSWHLVLRSAKNLLCGVVVVGVVMDLVTTVLAVRGWVQIRMTALSRRLVVMGLVATMLTVQGWVETLMTALSRLLVVMN